MFVSLKCSSIRAYCFIQHPFSLARSRICNQASLRFHFQARNSKWLLLQEHWSLELRFNFSALVTSETMRIRDFYQGTDHEFSSRTFCFVGQPRLEAVHKTCLTSPKSWVPPTRYDKVHCSLPFLLSGHSVRPWRLRSPRPSLTSQSLCLL